MDLNRFSSHHTTHLLWPWEAIPKNSAQTIQIRRLQSLYQTPPSPLPLQISKTNSSQMIQRTWIVFPDATKHPFCPWESIQTDAAQKIKMKGLESLSKTPRPPTPCTPCSYKSLKTNSAQKIQRNWIVFPDTTTHPFCLWNLFQQTQHRRSK